MDAYEAAQVLAFALNKAPWRADASLDEVTWTNEDGERFRFTIEEITDEDA